MAEADPLSVAMTRFGYPAGWLGWISSVEPLWHVTCQLALLFAILFMASLQPLS